MELRHLAYFVAVAEEESFTRAAARLHVVQSAVSAGIKTLERELRAELVHRSSREVALTDAGSALLPMARATLDSARAAVDAVDRVRGGLRGELRIGMMTSTPVMDLPAVFGRMHAAHPDVTLRLSNRPAGSQDLAAAVLAGQLDLAIMSEPRTAVRGLHVVELLSVPMRLLVLASHPLAAQDRVRLARIAGEEFIDQPVGFGSRTVVDRAFAAAGVTRHVAIEVSDLATVADYVRNGLGVAVLPVFAVPDDSRTRVLDLAGTDLSWPMYLALPADRRPSAAARVLAGMLQEAAVARSPAEHATTGPGDGQ